MNSIQLKSYAKVNLFLDILNIRDDGYHQLDMINSKISLYDDIVCRLLDHPTINLSVSDPAIPNDKSNTAYKAAELFFEKAMTKQQGIQIEIEKRIPHGAGLGGGSSNAGYVLLAMNKLFDTPLTQEDLIDIGKKIGADVPFFIVEGCAHVGGIGEFLKPIKIPIKHDDDSLWVVLCSPHVHVSTKEAFALWDHSEEKKHSSADVLEKVLQQGEFSEVHHYLFNSFEPVIYAAHSEIDQVYKDFCDTSPTQPLLSGSGSNMFSIHTQHSEAEDTCNQLLRKGHSAQVLNLVFNDHS